MKKAKFINFTMLIIAIILQAVTFCDNPSGYYENGFATGISNLNKHYDVALSLIYVILPFAFILFLFGGTVQDITHGYGKLLIIRNYSKSKLILRQIGINILLLLAVILIQCGIFAFINPYLNKIEHGRIQTIIMYFVIVQAVILLQSYLEFYMAVQNAQLIILIYSFFSYYIVQITEENILLKILLFPSLMFGMQNGAVDVESSYYIYLGTGIFINLILVILCIRKFKKSDIF